MVVALGLWSVLGRRMARPSTMARCRCVGASFWLDKVCVDQKNFTAAMSAFWVVSFQFGNSQGFRNNHVVLHFRALHII